LRREIQEGDRRNSRSEERDETGGGLMRHETAEAPFLRC
jgi:hypothetical protein